MELLHKYGNSLIFIVIFLEQLGLPIPASPILVLAGALLAGGEASLKGILIASLLGHLREISSGISGKERTQRIEDAVSCFTQSGFVCTKNRKQLQEVRNELAVVCEVCARIEYNCPSHGRNVSRQFPFLLLA
jgi:hypothetical protein